MRVQTILTRPSQPFELLVTQRTHHEGTLREIGDA